MHACLCVGGLFCELPLLPPPRAAAGVDGAEALSHWLFSGPDITFHCPFFLSRLFRALSAFLFCFVFALGLSPLGSQGVKTKKQLGLLNKAISTPGSCSGGTQPGC